MLSDKYLSKPKDIEEERINIELANGFMTSMDSVTTGRVLIDHSHLSNLIGQLMQYIEATYQDKEQREAHKGIVKNICREWLTHQYEWQKGWEVAYHVNPNNKISNVDGTNVTEWTNKYIIGEESN